MPLAKGAASSRILGLQNRWILLSLRNHNNELEFHLRQQPVSLDSRHSTNSKLPFSGAPNNPKVHVRCLMSLAAQFCRDLIWFASDHFLWKVNQRSDFTLETCYWILMMKKVLLVGCFGCVFLCDHDNYHLLASSLWVFLKRTGASF